MSNKFRNELLIILNGNVSNGKLDEVINNIDILLQDYKIEEEKHEIVPYTQHEEQLVQYYLVNRQFEGLKKATLDNIYYTLNNFIVNKTKPFNEITEADIKLYLFRYQDKTKNKTNTMNKIRERLLTFFTWLNEEGYIDSNPVKKVKKFKEPYQHRDALTRYELEELRNACRNERETALVEFLYSTGFRNTEVCNTKLSDIDWDTRIVTTIGKNDKYREDYINDRCYIALQKYLKVRNGYNDYLFTNSRAPKDGYKDKPLTRSTIESILRDIVSRTTITKKVTPHVIRHTFATIAIQSGVPVDQIRMLLGHSNISTTMIYAETNLEDTKVSHSKFIV